MIDNIGRLKRGYRWIQGFHPKRIQFLFRKHYSLLPAERMTPLLDEVQQLCNIVGKSIVTAKGNQQKPKQL